jgi:F-type H+-transporting ATPase subunit epsilon
MSEIELHIITPLGQVLDAKVESVTVPTTSGVVTILPHHIPLVSVLKAGELVVTEGGEKVAYAVWNGVLEVASNDNATVVTVLVNRSEKAAEINVEQAQAAYKRAKDIQDGIHESDVDFARFESLMEKELNRVHIGKKYR